MNPGVDNVPFKEMAKRNLQDLSMIETEIFGAKFSPTGAIILRQPKYWTVRNDGMISAYLRLEPGEGISNPFAQEGGGA
jgi:hypothetical protein